MLKRTSLFLLLVSGILTSGEFVFANSIGEVPPGHWRADFWRFSVHSEYFTSDANFSSSGTKTFNKLEPGNKIQVYEIRPKLRYNISERSSYFFGGGIVGVNSNTGAILRNNSGVSEAFAGFDYILSGKFSRLVGEVEASYAPTPFSGSNGDALMSDGADFIRAQVFFFRPYSFGNPYLHIGVQYRDQGFSQLMLYGGGFEKPLGKSFLAGAGLEGELSFISDSNNSIYRTALTDQTMGGSHYFASYNPSFVDARFWGGYKPESGWQIKLGYAQSFLGTNAGYGQSVFLNFSINFDPRADDEGFAKFQQTKSSARRKGQKDLKEFEPDPERTTDELFKDEQRFEPLN